MDPTAQYREDPLTARPGLAEIARYTTALAWLRRDWPTTHQHACVCVACEAATRRARLLDQVNGGQYEAEE
jgi:hypothetical protein